MVVFAHVGCIPVDRALNRVGHQRNSFDDLRDGLATISSRDVG
jgi:hypothetical protein